MTISKFDNNPNITVTGSLPLTGNKYNFTLSQTGLSAKINGTFFGPAAAETGGNFAVHTTAGPTYIASGIFAGKQ